MLQWETFPDKDGHRWRALAGNGRVVAISADAYPSDRNARRAMTAFQAAARGAPAPATHRPVLDRCKCAKPKLSPTATNVCTACGRLRG